MEYNNIIDLYNSVWETIKSVNMTEKAISIVITLILLLISLRVTDVILKRIFNEKKEGLTNSEIKRIITLKKVSRTFIRGAFYIITVLILISYFVDVGAILAVAGVGTIAIGLGARALVEDLMSGFVIVFENQFCVGDYVTLDNDHYGIVESIGIRTTAIRQLDGSLFIIHNGQINELVNYSKGTIKAIVDVGVAYEENIDNVMAVLKEVCDDVYDADNSLFIGRPEVLGVTRMDPSSMNIRIMADEDAARKVKAETALRKRIKEVFDERQIEIPYNKYVVYSDELEKENARRRRVISG